MMKFHNIVTIHVNTDSLPTIYLGCRKYVEPTVVSHSYGSDEFNMMFFTQVSLKEKVQKRICRIKVDDLTLRLCNIC